MRYTQDLSSLGPRLTARLRSAVGDALGTTLEFKAPGAFEPICDMIGGGPFRLQPGQWTDDTSMALCLAESLVSCRGFDPKDQMERYCRWWQEGYLSCTGRCFDIGVTVSRALAAYCRTGDPFSGLTDPYTAGNGSLMRLAPVALAYGGNVELAIHYAAESSRTTHGAPAAVDACRFYAALICGALAGRAKEELLSSTQQAEWRVPGVTRALWTSHVKECSNQNDSETQHLPKGQ